MITSIHAKVKNQPLQRQEHLCLNKFKLNHSFLLLVFLSLSCVCRLYHCFERASQSSSIRLCERQNRHRRTSRCQCQLEPLSFNRNFSRHRRRCQGRSLKSWPLSLLNSWHFSFQHALLFFFMFFLNLLCCAWEFFASSHVWDKRFYLIGSLIRLFYHSPIRFQFFLSVLFLFFWLFRPSFARLFLFWWVLEI